jgi:predicted aminopeptidase
MLPNTKTTHEIQGARMLLQAMSELPPICEALRMLGQGTGIAEVGNWLQNNILEAFREKVAAIQAQNECVHIWEQQDREREGQRMRLEINQRRIEADYAALNARLNQIQIQFYNLEDAHKKELAAKDREIDQLRQKNTKLKELTAKQYRQLQQLTGTNPSN